MSRSFILLCVLVLALIGHAGVPVQYRLPADGPLPKTYRVTLAIVDAKNPNWVISQFVAGAPRTVTVENKGVFTEMWDGLDDNYMPVPPGSYGVKGIYLPAKTWAVDGQPHALTAKLHGGPFCWLPTLAEDQQDRKVYGDPCWSPPGDVATAPNGKACFYWIYLENGSNNFLVDLNKPIGLGQVEAGYPSGGAAGGTFTATDGTTIWSACRDGGAPFIYRADGRFGTGRARWRDRVFLPGGEVGGLAAWRDGEKSYVYAAVLGKDRADSKLLVLDGGNAAVLATLPLDSPSALKARGGRLYALQQIGGQWCVRSVALKAGLPDGDWQELLRIKGVAAPADFDIDSHGRGYTCDSDANQVYRLNADGTVAKTFGRLPVQAPGHYDPHSFMHPTRVETWTDPQGQDRVIVVETDGPARIAEWSPEGEILREWQTLQAAGNNGYAVDPEHPEQVYIGGAGQPGWLTRFRVDYASGRWIADAVWPNIDAGMKTGWAPHGYGYPRIVHREGRTYLVYGRGYAVYRFDGDRIVPSAGILRRDKATFTWHDANGNGAIDEAETAPLTVPAGVFGYWGGDWQEDLALLALAEGGRELWRLAPDSFDAHGNPVFTQWTKVLSDPVMIAKAAGTADAVHGGNEVYDTINSAWRAVAGTPAQGFFTDIRGGALSANFGVEQKISRYDPDGKGGYRLRWRVGRCASITNDPNGLIGSFHISAPIHGLIGVIDQSRAGCQVYTAEDGLYVDTLMQDGSFARRNIYGSGGEFFAGGVYENTDNGKVYLAWGKTTPYLCEIEGWTKNLAITKIATLPKSVTIAAKEIADPPVMALRVRGSASKATVARILPAGSAPALDGSRTGWEYADPIIFGSGANQVEACVLYRPEALYLRWAVRRDSPLAIKPLQPAERLFTHDRGADTMSLYLQGDPNAVGATAAGRPGDVRIIFGLFDDRGTVKPVAFGLYPSWDGKRPATPFTYGTQVGMARFAHAGLLPDVQMGYKLDADGKGFVLSAAVPRGVLPAALPDLTNGLRTMINFEATLGGNLKCWWSNGDGTASRETNDEPTEARLYPGSWAPAHFVPIANTPVRLWHAIGPFGLPEIANYDIRDGRTTICRLLGTATFLPEKGIDLKASYQGPTATTRKGKHRLAWRSVALTGDQVDLERVLGWKGWEDEGTTYLVTYLFAPQDCTVALTMLDGHGHHGIRGWLNNMALPGTGKADAVTSRLANGTPLALQAGWNKLLLRYDLIWGDNMLGATLNAAPEVLWGVRQSATPPAEYLQAHPEEGAPSPEKL
jgi:hypothetical protein